MSHKNFSFWFCTLLSGIVIGIASQRIPEAHATSKSVKPHPYSFYCSDQNPLSSQPLSSFQMQKSGCSFSHDVRYHHPKKGS